MSAKMYSKAARPSEKRNPPSCPRPTGPADITTKEQSLPQHIAAATQDMARNADSVAAYLKTMAHQGRLMILCHLGTGEKSVGTLEQLLDMRQAAVSQMLARLREEGFVKTRRSGKTVYYSLANNTSAELITVLHRMFCNNDA